MKQIDKIKMLVGILEENVGLLENHPEKEKEWEKKRKEYKEKYGDSAIFYDEYPTQGTSRSHIENIARLIRKELLKI